MPFPPWDRKHQTQNLLDNYFDILGLSPDATLADIKRNYRTLVKQFHPDVNADPDARLHFIRIHEAYEYLLDDHRRTYFRMHLQRSRISDEEQKRRDFIYKAWAAKQQRDAQVRAESYASSSFKDFTRSRLYRSALVVSKGYNYLFMAICLLVVVLPLVRVATRRPGSEELTSEAWHVVFPVFIGLLFSGIGYYYLFVLKSDE